MAHTAPILRCGLTYKAPTHSANGCLSQNVSTCTKHIPRSSSTQVYLPDSIACLSNAETGRVGGSLVRSRVSVFLLTRQARGDSRDVGEDGVECDL